MMKVAFFATYYGSFLQSFLSRNPSFSKLPYSQQHERLVAEPFGSLCSYVRAARRQGVEAHLLVSNLEPLQRQWAKENGVPLTAAWRHEIVAAQIRALKPDVLFISSMFEYYGDWVRRLADSYGTLVGWISCPMPPDLDLGGFHLMVSSLPSLVDDFRRRGLRAEVLKAGFDVDVLAALGQVPATVDVSFVGGLSVDHVKRRVLLENVARAAPLKMWGYIIPPEGRRARLLDYLKPDILKRVHQGEAWGLDMYRVLAGSRITLNAHIDMAGDAAVNMRMYEATGVGTLLLTDAGRNLGELFVPGKELVTYETPEDAVEKIRYYLAHEDERKKIALAGQQRTLGQYTHDHVMVRMLDIFKETA
jgi:spore maturation protein CgeB